MAVLPSPQYSPWVVLVPFSLPGETVIAKIYRHSKMHSYADLVRVVTPNTTLRDDSLVRCKYFGTCGGCQYQVRAELDILYCLTQRYSSLGWGVFLTLSRCSPMTPSFYSNNELSRKRTRHIRIFLPPVSLQFSRPLHHQSSMATERKLPLTSMRRQKAFRRSLKRGKHRWVLRLR